MENVEAVYILIIAEAERRHKEMKTSDLCGKVVEVSQEISQKLLGYMKETRREERENEVSNP